MTIEELRKRLESFTEPDADNEWQAGRNSMRLEILCMISTKGVTQ